MMNGLEAPSNGRAREEDQRVPEPWVAEILDRMSRLEVKVAETLRVAECIHDHADIEHEPVLDDAPVDDRG